MIAEDQCHEIDMVVICQSAVSVYLRSCTPWALLSPKTAQTEGPLREYLMTATPIHVVEDTITVSFSLVKWRKLSYKHWIALLLGGAQLIESS